ncbi:uncharacterized protein LOC123557915 isoform X1 [Mercenaria mercenaria]|uniref:uncharacterized protein LOC123557915 isoform X1 n=1 Tax=Mercenaria mercenaria TaxID=6596 RepID=UPI00234EC2ED|nr:uncharacterized protein LOC123557915 isoform X1 [Mercenaria mercenaria]
MEPPASKKPRVRAKNFSMSEVEVLKTAVTDNFSTISAKHCNGSGGITKKIQDKAWATICEKVNSVGNAKRSVAEVKEKWRNLTKKAKTETTMQKVSMQKTGGGPPAPLPDPLLDDIAGLFCSSASFHGIPGATDCETVTISLRLDEEDAYADEIPSMVINAEELQKVDEISSAANSAAPIQGSRASAAPCPSSSTSDRVSSAANSAAPIQGSRASAAPCPSSSTSDREPLVCDKSSKHQNELVNHFTKMPQKSLKELQMEFYTVSIQNEREKFKLIQEQTALCRELRENIPKLSLVLDALCTKKR